ncbi:MAG TPA: hypothetical protein DDW27_07610 [Bacteroidales bacterium]|nr:hypothetical protein [Bacteroidales bacterium]
MSRPVRVTPEIAGKLSLNPDTFVQVGGIWGRISSGQNYMALDGIRQVISANNLQIFYFQQEQLWAQEAHSFIGEIRTYPAIKGAQRALGMATIVEWEVNIILGIVAASSGFGLAVVVGTDIFKFLVDNKENFGKWHQGMVAILKARAVLKVKAPALYEKVFESFLKQLRVAISSGMGDALTKPDTAGKLVGVLIGKIGKTVVQSRFTILGVIWILFSSVATKIMTSVPSAINISVGEYKTISQDLINQLKSIGVAISPSEIQVIFKEIAKDPEQIRRVFFDLQSEFKEAGLM